MDPRKNPFAPGAGAKPPAFIGRENLIEAADIALDRIAHGLHANGQILLGLRGVGKTVLLNALLETAREKAYLTVHFEVRDISGTNLVQELVPELDRILRSLDRAKAAETLLTSAAWRLQALASMFKVSHEGVSFGVAPPDAGAMIGNLERDLPVVMDPVLRAAKDRGFQVALFIDEVQYLSKDELSALARACHAANQTGLPFILFATGLPQIAALAGDAKSYAERLFDYPEVGALAPEAAAAALSKPVEAAGLSIDPQAVRRIVAETERYAYFLQTWGKFAWNYATEPTITEADVVDARPEIDQSLDQSFFRVRFDQCSPSEQRYLRGMAELGSGPHQTGDIAAVLGAKSTTVAPVRKKLIGRGMIYSQRHGETAFTVPLFDHFMKRAMPRLQPYSTKGADT